MNLYYLDTSALVKRYRPEKGSENLDELFKLSSPTQKRMITSLFSVVEFTSAGNRLTKEGVISNTTYDQLILTFSEDTNENVHFIPLDDEIIFNGVEIVKKYGLKPGDAIQLSSAIRSLVTVSDYNVQIIFVASDRALCSAAAHEGFSILDPIQLTKKDWISRLK